MAGEEKLPSLVVATGTVDGQDQMLIVTIGPKATLAMKLFVGTYPPTSFTADMDIAEELRQ
jgi:hypothetical protein